MIITTTNGTLVELTAGTVRTVRGPAGYITKSGKSWAARRHNSKTVSEFTTRREAIDYLTM